MLVAHTFADAPPLMKSLAIDHARDGDVMIAFAMNSEQLPLLNGFPVRLVVPGWYATYWIKMLSDIEVLEQPDTNYWMAEAYKIPDTPHANITPDQQGVKMIPINRMVPRSFITNLNAGATLAAHRPEQVRGIAFGGDCGVKSVDISSDGGKSWRPDPAWQGSGPVQLSRVAGAGHAAVGGPVRVDGPLHQQQQQIPANDSHGVNDALADPSSQMPLPPTLPAIS